MDVTGYHHSDSITINRPPANVYALVCDVTRIGELSPVCQSATWDDPAHAGEPGAWFTGHNVIGELTWDTHCEVVTAEPDQEFAFINHGRNADRDLVRWGYTFEPDGDATVVTESWQVLADYPDFVLSGDPNADVAARIDGMAQMALDGIKDTLANLKRVAEA